MSLRYLPEHAENARFALALAQKEAAHLAYTRHTLFDRKIDAEWVEGLEQHQDLAEKVDAFVSRFGRLQDHIGERLLPRFAALFGETPKTLLDVLAVAERAGWIDDAETFIGARKLRNLLVHEYLSDTALFLRALLDAEQAVDMLLTVIERVQARAADIGLTP